MKNRQVISAVAENEFLSYLMRSSNIYIGFLRLRKLRKLICEKGEAHRLIMSENCGFKEI